MAKEKSTRGTASQFFVAGELARRGYAAVVTLGNTPNTDVLCSNIEGTRFVHIQVKTFVPGTNKCMVGQKAEKDFGDNFFWVLGGIPEPGSEDFEYYVIPAREMAPNIKKAHSRWLADTGKRKPKHEDSGVRIVWLKPHSGEDWDVAYSTRIAGTSSRKS